MKNSAYEKKFAFEKKKFERFHRPFYSVRHIFTFVGLGTNFSHKVLPELLVLLSVRLLLLRIRILRLA